MLYIVPDSPTTAEHVAPPGPRKVVVFIEECPLEPGLAARLSRDGTVLRVDPDATEDDQLRAIRDAISYLWMGVVHHGRPRLRLVGTSP